MPHARACLAVFFAVLTGMAILAFPAHAGNLQIKCQLKTRWKDDRAGTQKEFSLDNDETWMAVRDHCDFSSTHLLFFRGEIDRDLGRATDRYYSLRMVQTKGRQTGVPEPLVFVTSRGGNLTASLHIGRLLHNMRAAVYVDGPCLSSCVFLLAGGVKRRVYGFVGVHRPFRHGDDTETSFEAAADNSSRVRKKTVAYLADMHIPVSLYDLMIRTPPQAIRILGPQDLRFFGLNDLEPAPVPRRHTQAAEGQKNMKVANAGKNEDEDDGTFALHEDEKADDAPLPGVTADAL